MSPGYLNRSRFKFLQRKQNLCRFLCFILSILFSAICCNSFGQRADIQQLKEQLILLNDSAKVDCLNLLSLEYTYLHGDTAQLYAQKAGSISHQIKYQRGNIVSLNNRAHIAGFCLHDYPAQQAISLQTIQEFKNSPNAAILTDTYMNLALSLFCQSFFSRAKDVCNRLIQLSQNTGNSKMIGEAIVLLGCIELETGNYEKCFEYFNKSLAIFKNSKDDYNTAIVLSKLGDLYSLAGDQKTALSFYFQSLQFPKGVSLVWRPLADLGDTYYLPGPDDSASTAEGNYIQSVKWLTIRSNHTSLPELRKAELYLKEKEFDKALLLLMPAFEAYTKSNDHNLVMRAELAVARAYTGKKQFRNAMQFAQLLLHNAIKYRAWQYMRDGYQVLYSLYDNQSKTDSAYKYFRKYTLMKDSVALDKFSKQLAMYKAASESEKKQAKIELLENDQLINQQQLQLSNQALKGSSFQKNMLFAGILILALMGAIIFRNFKLQQKNTAHRHSLEKNELSLQKLESERSKSELQQHATELEMQALRAQMNPHFIFNSLNSINRFILQNKTEKASEYLTKFSRLIRLILQNSQSVLIPLENELEALEVYLELEAERFDNHFQFRICIDNSLDTGAIRVPPLIIQPYAENAIWHGLMHKDEKGSLLVDVYAVDDYLCCKITDDGIGRKKAVELKSKSAATHKSMGMQITASRIALMQDAKNQSTQVSIADLVLPDGSAGGTEVLINIPLNYG